MNPLEKEHCKTHRVECGILWLTGAQAVTQSLIYGTHADEINALRHAHWSAYMDVQMGKAAADVWKQLHEDGRANNPPGDRCRDERNNAIGSSVASAFPQPYWDMGTAYATINTQIVNLHNQRLLQYSDC